MASGIFINEDKRVDIKAAKFLALGIKGGN